MYLASFNTSVPFLLFSLVITVAAVTPNYQACVDAGVDDRGIPFPFCDPGRSVDERVEDLISRMTLREKISNLSPTNGYNECDTSTQGVPRLGVPRWMWLVEINTGAASSCLKEGQCSTVFASPGGLAASFNRTSWRLKGRVISTEMRAYSNANWHRGVGPKEYIGTTGYGPNINIVRDPRFGRNGELPSEDPLLSGEYAVEFTRGCQEEDKNGHPRLINLLKHFTAYSRETNRGHDSYNISQFDLWDTYLPQYQRAFNKANASGVMCSYNAINGVPSCINNYLLNDVIRSWNAKAVVTTDCGAVSNLMGEPVNASSFAQAAAFTINGGTDIEMGSKILGDHLEEALAQNLTFLANIDQALSRTFHLLMRTGRFDPVEDTDWTKITTDVVDSEEHRIIRDEASAQSYVLLKNDFLEETDLILDKFENFSRRFPENLREKQRILPLPKGKTIAVIGPQAVSQHGLFSDYYGDAVCFNKTWSCVRTIAEAIANANSDGHTYIAKGVNISDDSTYGIPEAIEYSLKSDIVVLVLGIDFTVEHEGKDRDSITLPPLQQTLALSILALQKPTVLILVNGGMVSIEELMDPFPMQPNAIIEAFYPAKGADQLARTLFGDLNRWGRLPVSIYPTSYITQLHMADYNITKYPGRTYRYHKAKPLFNFGDGLSYSTFEFAPKSNLSPEPKISSEPTISTESTISSESKIASEPKIVVDFGEKNINISAVIRNSEGPEGDCVVLIFCTPSVDVAGKIDTPVPMQYLIAFERFTLPKDSTLAITIQADIDDLKLVDSHGNRKLISGSYTLKISLTGRAESLVTIQI
ncbi:hypothetical protein AAMO2058_000054800 [Amorphochlora amoebiformis]